MKTFKFILLGMIIFSQSSCSQSLNRSNVKNIILNEKQANFNQIDFYGVLNNGIGGYYFYLNDMYIGSDNLNLLLQKLTDEGYLRLVSEYFGTKYYSYTNKILPFQYKTNFFKIAEIDDIIVNGISGDDNYKVAECTVVYKPTEIGKLILEKLNLSRKMIFNFKKYDDGWRLNN